MTQNNPQGSSQNGTPGEAAEAVKVLYLAGMGRSGSTVLGRLLGELPGAVHVGELGLFCSPRFRSHGRCGCLKPLIECDFWRAVFERAFGGLDALDWEALHATRREYRLRALPLRLLPDGPRRDKRLREYLSVLGALYAAVRAVSGANVVVDGSKDAPFGYLLGRTPGVDLRAVHLIRDSRAVAHSFRRIKKDPPLFPDPHQLPRAGSVATALHWNAVNGLLGLQAEGPRLTRLRYEDFAADPEAALRRLWEFAGEPPPPLEFLRGSPLRLRPGHTVAGNPDRFQPEIKIAPDLEWQRKMPARDRNLVTALTFPLLRRHGYLRPALPEARTHIQPSRVL